MSRQWLPWITSAVTLYGMWLLGSKKRSGWIVGIANQGLWIVTSIAFHTWGFLPLSASLLVTYTRNLLRWRADDIAFAAAQSVDSHTEQERP